VVTPQQHALTPVYPFFSPDTPDLGCFVSVRHDFEVDESFLWPGYPPWTTLDGVLPHQCYFRVVCGNAAYYERIKVTMGGLDPLIYAGINPDYLLGGDFRPYPSDWFKFPPQPGNMTYWFRGEYRNPSQSNWSVDTAVRHKTDNYENGFLNTVGWDDTGEDRDFNDIILEVAMVYRVVYFNALGPGAPLNEAEFKRFVETKLPNIDTKDRPPSRKSNA
jgi:hypothetical protein